MQDLWYGAKSKDDELLSGPALLRQAAGYQNKRFILSPQKAAGN